jgi:hypothetical protein
VAALTVDITLSSQNGSFASGDPNSWVLTVLHELGHAIYDLYGPVMGIGQIGSNYAIKPDYGNSYISDRNDAAIRKNCL